MRVSKWLRPNALGAYLLMLSFGYSAVRYARVSLSTRAERSDTGGLRVIRVLHWQLEPGYREGLQSAIDRYNRLPHVREAGVEVRQIAVPEQVYAQFINVHLISGTAPDICVAGMSQLLGATAANARYFEPISGFVREPNPYNAPEFLPPDLPQDLKEYLRDAAWNQTFTDGMLGGWDELLQDYYAVPVSSWGTARTFYNRDLLLKVKAWMRPRLDEPWARELIEEARMVQDDSAFRGWADSDAAPDTLGRFIVFAEAARQFAAQTPGFERFSPISASNYGITTMVDRYVTPFTYRLADRLDINRDALTHSTEILGGWQAGLWDMNEPVLRDGFFDVVRWLARYYPTGFLGLDREQSTRRFINGQAIFLTTGGWDAGTLFANAEGRFEVGVMEAPMPAPGERWFEHYAGRASEADQRLGVPMSIYRRSPNKEWALDFLRFLTSFSVNQEMNAVAGWIPSIVGARPVETMRPFAPNLEGLHPSVRIQLGWMPTVGTLYNGLFPLFQSGDISYDEFAGRLEEGYGHPRTGVDRVWEDAMVRSQDQARQLERALGVLHLRIQQGGDVEDLQRQAQILLESNLRDLDGFGPHWMRERLRGE
ncbi:MAG: extracellular solute-binding protein [Verrucomicrobia bacterium]|nr:extracellular solute-binding protein [Verrucomicrobiota bacterium]MCH8527526.1 extracellular solute-binding protein [Kiritimatiellia bacterium]